MFERFDDDVPFVPGTTFRAATLARGRRMRRRRILTRTAVVAAAALVAGIGAVGAAVDRRLDSIDRIEIDTIGEAPPVEGPVNVLVAGADLGGLTDSLAVVRIDAAAAAVTVLPIPRDTWVPIGGRFGSREGRINAAVGIGGLDLLVATVEGALGIPIDHVVQIDGDGFVAAVDRIGGIAVDVSVPLRDRATGILFAEPGCRTLDGEQALALVRSRHVQTLEEGEWVTSPLGDLGRIQIQEVVARSVASSLLVSGAEPGELWDLGGVLADHGLVDSGLTDERLVSLARAAIDIGPGGIRYVSLPVEGATEGQAAVLHLVEGPALDEALAAVGGPPAQDPAPLGVAGGVPLPAPPVAPC